MSAKDRIIHLVLQPTLAIDSSQLRRDISCMKETIQTEIDKLTDKPIDVRLKFGKIDTGVLGEIKESLSSINATVNSINSKSLGTTISLGVTRKSGSDVQSLAERARALAQALDDAHNKLLELYSGGAKAKQIDDQLLNLLVSGNIPQLSDLMGKISGAEIQKSSAKIATIIGQLKSYLELFSKSGVDVDTSLFDSIQSEVEASSKAVDNLAQKVSDIVNPRQSQNSLIAGLSGADGVQESVNKMGGMFDNLRSKIEQALDLSTVEMNIDSVNKRISQISVISPGASFKDNSGVDAIQETVRGLDDVASGAERASAKIAQMPAAMTPAVEAAGKYKDAFATANEYIANNAPRSMSVVYDETGKVIEQTSKLGDAVDGVVLSYRQVQKESKKGTTITNTLTVSNDDGGKNAAKRALEDYINKLVDATDKAYKFGLTENESTKTLIANYGKAASLLESFDKTVSAKGLNYVKQVIDELTTSSRGAENEFKRLLSAAEEESKQQEKYQREVSRAYEERDRQIEKEAKDAERAAASEQKRSEKEQRNIESEINGWQELAKKKDEAYEKDRSASGQNKMQRDLEGYIASLDRTINESERLGIAESENVDVIRSARNEAQKLLDTLDERVQSSGVSGVRDEFDGIATSANNAKIRADEAINTFKRDHVPESGTKEYYEAIGQLEKLKGQILGDIQKSSKARHGKSADDYQALRNQIVELDNLSVRFKNGELSGEQFAQELARIRTQATQASNGIRQAGEMTLSFNDKIKKNLSTLSAYFSVHNAIIRTIRYVRDLINTAIELDKAMTQLKIVTRDTDVAYESFSKSIAKTAKEISASMTDLISATTTYARLGYSLDESSILAKYTAMLQQVGNIDASSAQDAITAITKAFSDEINIDDIESVMDRLVVVGNNFPISVSQIAEALNNSASSLSAAGNTFNESVALLAAANATVQNASKSSTAVRTITARLRNSKAELEELGEEVMTTAKYQELLNVLTENNVQIVDQATGKYNSTYKIMQQLASVWDNLNDGIKATITTQVASIRNVDVFNSILHNFKETAQEAMEAMDGSADALNSAYAEYTDSAAAHINTLKAAWQELSAAAVDSGVVSSIVDAGTSIIEVMQSIASSSTLKGLSDLISVLASAVASVIKFADSLYLIEGATNALVAGGAISALSKLLTEIGFKMIDLQSKVKYGGDAIGNIGANIANVGLKILSYANIIGAVIGLTVTLIKNIKKAKEEAIAASIESAAKAAELSDNLQNIAERYRDLKEAGDLEGIKSLQSEITNLVGDQADNLDLVNGKLDEQLSKIHDIILAQAKDPTHVATLIAGYDSAMESHEMRTMGSAATVTLKQMQKSYEVLYQNLANAGKGASKRANDIKQNLQDVNDKIEKISDSARNLAEQSAIVNVFENINDSVFESSKSVSEFTNEMVNAVASGDRVSEAISNGYLSLKDIKNIVVDIIGLRYPEHMDMITGKMSINLNAVEKYRKSLSNLADSVEKLKDRYDLINKATEEMESGEGISYDTLKNLMQSYENYTDYLYEANGQLKIRVGLLRQEADASYRADVLAVQREIASLEQERNDAIMARAEMEKAGADTSLIQDQIDKYGKMIEDDREQLRLFEAIYNTVIEASRESTSSVKEEEKAITSLSDAVSELSKNYDILVKAREEMDEDGELSVETIEAIIAATEDYTDILDVENGKIKLNENAWTKYYMSKYEAARKEVELQRNVLVATRTRLEGQMKLYAGMSAFMEEYGNQINEVNLQIEEQDEILKIYDALVDAVHSATDELEKEEEEAQSLSDAISELSRNFDILVTAHNEMAVSGKLSLSTIESIISATEDYADVLVIENGEIKLNEKAWKEYYTSKYNAAKKELEVQDEILKKQRDNIVEQMIAHKGEAAFMDEYTKKLAEVQEAIDENDWGMELYDTLLQIVEGSEDAESALSSFANALGDVSKEYDLMKSAQDEMAESGSLSLDTVLSILSASEEYVQFLEIENGLIKLNTKAFREYIAAQNESKITKIREEIVNIQSQLAELEEGSDEYISKKLEMDNLEKLADIYSISLESIDKTSNAVEEEVKDLSDVLSDASDKYKLLATAQEEMSEAGTLSYETVEKILSASPDYLQFLKEENGLIKFNTEAFRDYIRAQNEAQIEKMSNNLVSMSAKIAMLRVAGADAEADALEIQRDSLADLISVYKALFETLDEGEEEIENYADAISKATKQQNILADAQKEMTDAGTLSAATVEEILSNYPEYIKFLEVENGCIRLNTKALQEYIDAQNKAEIERIVSKIADLREQMSGLDEDSEEYLNLKSQVDDLEKLAEVYEILFDNVKNSSTEAKDAIGSLTDVLSEAADRYDLLASAQEEMSSAGYLSYETVQKILSASPDYLQFLEEENGLIKFNTEAFKEYAKAQNEAKIAEMSVEMASLASRIASLRIQGRNDEADELEAQKASLEKLIGVYRAMFNMLDQGEIEVKEFSEYLKELRDSFSDTSDAYEMMVSAQNEMIKSGGLSQSTVEKILSSSDDYIQFLYTEGGLIKLNAEALKQYVNAQHNAKIGEIYAKIADLRSQLSEMEAAGNKDGVGELLKQISSLEIEASVLETLFDSLSNGSLVISETSSFIDDMRDSLTDLASVEEIVSNGFIVAAENVKELAATFPELFANAEAYADGSMKLDEEVAKAFLANRQAETQATIESKIVELEAQLAATTAKKDFVDAEIELAKHAAESESKIDQLAAQYRIDNADAVAQALIDAGTNEAEAYAIASQSMFDNTFDLDNAIATATSDISQNYGEAFASAADNSATNTVAINSNIDKITQQAHQVATAIAGMASGKVQGREGVIKPGAAGSKKAANISGATMVTDSGTGNVNAMMQGVYDALRKSHVSLNYSEFIAKYFDSQISSKSLADLIIGKMAESDALAKLEQQLEGQIAVLKSLAKTDLSSFRGKEKTGSSSAGSGGSPSTSSGSGSGDNPFAIMYKEHQHLLAMEQEEVGDYFAWLDKASKEAYQKGWITLDDLRKYEEEVYKGLKEIISDAESAMKDLVSFRQKMLEQEYKDQQDTLKTQLELLKNFYDDQKKKLDEQREEEEYQKKKAEKQRAVTDIQAELAMLSYDNSASAQKRRLELQEQLAEAQKEFSEFESEHAYELAENALDAAYNKQASELQAQIDAIDLILNDPTALFNRALKDIKEDTGSLYSEMVEFAKENGEGESTVQRLWENAFIATQDLQTVTSENVQTIAELLASLPSDIANLITGFSMQNSTGYSTTSKESTTSTSTVKSSSSSGTTPSTGGGGSSSAIPVGTAVRATGRAYSTVKGTGNSVDVSGKKVYVAQIWDNNANPYWQGDYTYAIAYKKDGSIVGWVRKDQLTGYASGTRSASAGMHRIDERGQEALFVSSSGDHYRLLSDGDKVFNAEATDFLYRFANGDKDIFKSLFDGMFSRSALSNIANKQTIGDIRMGDIIINGNADRATVSEIRRAQREGVDSLLQQFGRLQRAAR